MSHRIIKAHNIEKVGSRIASTKLKYSWNVFVNGKSYIIDVFHSRLTGKYELRVNGAVWDKKQVTCFGKVDFSINVNKGRVEIVKDHTDDCFVCHVKDEGVEKRYNPNIQNCEESFDQKTTTNTYNLSDRNEVNAYLNQRPSGYTNQNNYQNSPRKVSYNYNYQQSYAKPVYGNGGGNPLTTRIGINEGQNLNTYTTYTNKRQRSHSGRRIKLDDHQHRRYISPQPQTKLQPINDSEIYFSSGRKFLKTDTIRK